MLIARRRRPTLDGHTSVLKFVVITLGAGMLFGWAFWIGWGHRLHINVYADGDFWYAEEFTEPANYHQYCGSCIWSVRFGRCLDHTRA